MLERTGLTIQIKILIVLKKEIIIDFVEFNVSFKARMNQKIRS